MRLLPNILTACALFIPSSALAEVPAETPVERPPAADASAEDRTDGDSAEPESDWVAFPLIAYSPETSLLFAVTSLFLVPAEDSRHPSRVAASAVYTLRDQAVVVAGTDWVFDGADWELVTNVVVSRWILDYFAEPSQPDAIELESGSMGGRAVVMRRIAGDLFAGLGFDATARDLSRDSGEVPALGAPSASTMEHRLELRWDTRSSRIAARSGVLAHVGVDLAPGYGNTGSYWRWQGDLRGYQTWSGHTLAGRARVEQNSASTPFFKQATVGGTQRLRGVLRNRFRDDWSVSQQFEYRSPSLVWRFGLAVFAGYGAVGGTGETHHVVSGGGGLRLLLIEDQNVSLRLDGGISTTDTGVYLSIGEAF